MKIKTCKCGNQYEQYNTLQNMCVDCLIKKGRKKLEKEFRKETKRRKEKLKGRQDYLKEAQSACNKYIRLRDKLDGCISCDKPASWGGQWHASHYRPAGNCSSLRFHPLNIHKSCSECNNHKSGNLIEYRIRLIYKIGKEKVEWLESQNSTYKWDINDLKEIKKFYEEQTKLICIT